MSDVLVVVDGQALTVADAPKIAAQGVKEDNIVFTFDDSWSGFGRTAIFYRSDNEDDVYTSIVSGEGKALVPHEVTDQPGEICFGVYGVKGDVILTSEILKYKIVEGRYDIGQQSEVPTPGIYQQMLTLAGQMTTQSEAIYLAVQDVNANVAALTATVSNVVRNYNVQDLEVVLFQNSPGIRGTGTEVTIAQPVTNFDYIDIYINSAGENEVSTVPAEENKDYTLRTFNLSNYTGGSGVPAISGGEIKVRFSGTTMRIPNHSYVRFSTLSGDPIGGNVDAHYADMLSGSEGRITKVVGRKSIGNAEVEDIRVGVDGTVYSSAGDAVRAQINAIAGGMAVSVDLDGIMHFVIEEGET